MSLDKIAVVFPGVGYNIDKPLLYYARKLAREAGYKVVEVTYEFPYNARDIKDNPERMKEAFVLAAEQAGRQLSDVEFDECSEVVFIGKSIGTAIAAYYANENNINARQIVMTPVPQTFDFMSAGCGVVFHGLSDPWCGNEIVRAKCSELNLKLVEIPDANHSLETGNVIEDIKNLQHIMEIFL